MPFKGSSSTEIILRHTHTPIAERRTEFSKKCLANGTWSAIIFNTHYIMFRLHRGCLIYLSSFQNCFSNPCRLKSRKLTYQISPLDCALPGTGQRGSKGLAEVSSKLRKLRFNCVLTKIKR